VTAIPGLSVLIRRPGQIPLRWTAGLAHLESATPVTERTAFTIGSTAKQLTAHLTLLAADDHLLRLDQPIADFVPALRVPDVTLTELITHHSGIRDTESLLPLAGFRDLDHYTADDLIHLATRQTRRAVLPGAFLYSATNYLLLVRVLETIHGIPLDDLARERLFAPLGMTHSRFRTDPRDVIPHTASAYEHTATGWRSSAQPAVLPGAGSLTTTPEDLSRWLTHLHQHWTVHPGPPFEQHTAYVPSDHPPYLYGPGLYFDPRPGRTSVFHSGHEHGFSAAAHLTAHDTQIICMTNHADIDAAAAAHKLLQHTDNLTQTKLQQLLAPLLELPADPPPTMRPVAQDHEQLGTYSCPETPGTLRLTVCEGRLHLWRRGTADALAPAEPDTYDGPGYRLTLRGAQSEPEGFELSLTRAPGLAYRRGDCREVR
jgi:CubicO group peptidase (beta-lactamase class C family)